MKVDIKIQVPGGVFESTVDSSSAYPCAFSLSPADARRVASAMVIAADTVDALDKARAAEQKIVDDTNAAIAGL